ncbi:hypothetical protein P8452_71745 [Trifolium repens]|nr:hypothetical protein QL285_046370 [Trifolium repens]WJX89776.1 hypothetical protein P8452_71745 [Trifolium repens]
MPPKKQKMKSNNYSDEDESLEYFDSRRLIGHSWSPDLDDSADTVDDSVDQVSEGSDQVVSVAHPLTVEPELEQKEAENVIVVIPI